MADLIAAISTGSQRTALGVIRLTGEKCAETVSKALKPRFGGSLTDYAPRKLVLCDFVDETGAVLDEVLATYSPAPNSFTGEDTAEIQGHGSPIGLQSMLRALFRLGARQAGPGEFSRRAFLNGRMDLTQAEAIMDLIDSETAFAARTAAMQLRGSVSARTDAVYEQLLGLMAHFQAVVDYPEEGVEPLEAMEIAEDLHTSAGKLDRLLRSFERGQMMREGVKCAILGRPNAGKSSLLNALLGVDRAIVTDEAGTTRDTLEEKLTLGGLLLRLTDTAGLRETDSVAEQEGVRRACEAARTAKLVIAVFDGSRPLSQEDALVLDTAAEAEKAIAVVNKSDLPQILDVSALQSRFETILHLSAATGEGLDALERAVASLLDGAEPLEAGEILTNARQYDAILRASQAVRRAAAALEEGFTPDAVLTDAEEALLALGEVSGRTLREDLVEAVFSRFCVGK